MPHYVGLDVSQKTTAICVVDAQGKRLWRGVCATDPGPISARISQHAGVDAKVGIETGSMTSWLVHGLRAAGLDVACLDARRVKAALQMRLNKTDENDAEGLAQVMRTGWYRPVHVKSLDAHRARALRECSEIGGVRRGRYDRPALPSRQRSASASSHRGMTPNLATVPRTIASTRSPRCSARSRSG